MKLTKIYTKTGDNGTTSLVGGIRANKDSARLEAYGTIDELSSHIGLLSALLAEKNIAMPILDRIQSCLFNVGTYLATDTSQTPVYDSAKLPDGEISLIEQEIDTILPTLPELNSFVLPGGSVAAAQCHVARTVCRRAERCIVTLSHETDLNPEMLRYVNRLSDYFFVLARKINFLTHTEEKIWQKTCK